jgi:thiol-disulfide isomerase/thioredoxin
MKYLIIATVFLSLATQAQCQHTKAHIKPVCIGQMIPDVQLSNILNYKTKDLYLSDFEAKLIILDFWTSNSKPCVAMMPKLDSLQKEFPYDIQILSVTQQSQQEVLVFLQKLEQQNGIHYQIPVVTDDQELRLMFPHQTLPHYVWISANGTVQAITGAEDITSTNIDTYLNGQPLKFTAKTEASKSYNTKKLNLMSTNGRGEEQLIRSSPLAKYANNRSITN